MAAWLLFRVVRWRSAAGLRVHLDGTGLQLHLHMAVFLGRLRIDDVRVLVERRLLKRQAATNRRRP